MVTSRQLVLLNPHTLKQQVFNIPTYGKTTNHIDDYQFNELEKETIWQWFTQGYNEFYIQAKSAPNIPSLTLTSIRGKIFTIPHVPLI